MKVKHRMACIRVLQITEEAKASRVVSLLKKYGAQVQYNHPA